MVKPNCLCFFVLTGITKEKKGDKYIFTMYEKAKVNPVSTDGTYADKMLKFYTGEVVEGKLGDVELADSSNYISFDIYVKVSSATTLQLDHNSVVAMAAGSAADRKVLPLLPWRRRHFLLGGIGATVEQVFLNAAGEEVRGLQYITDVAVQPQLGALPVVHAVDENLTGGRLKEAAGQIDQRTLSRSVRSCKSDYLTCLDGE